MTIGAVLQWLALGDPTTENDYAAPSSSPAPAEGAEVRLTPSTDPAPTYFPAVLFPETPKPLPLPKPEEPATYSLSVASVPIATGVEQWRSLVASIFPADTVDTVLRVMQCESHGNPDAVSPTDDHGLMQINRVNFARFAGRSPYDPVANLEVAYAMSGGGYWWAPWSCRP